MRVVTITEIDNGFIIEKNTLMHTYRKYRRTISKSLLEEIKAFLEAE